MEQLYALRKFQSSMQMNRKAAINAIAKLKENNLKRTASECSNNSNQGTGERPEQALKHGLEAENQNWIWILNPTSIFASIRWRCTKSSAY